MHVDIDAMPGMPVSLFGAARVLPAPVVIPGVVGHLEIDPTIAFPVMQGMADASGRQAIALQVPNDPTLRGLPFFVQAADLSGAGEPRLGPARNIGVPST